MTDRQTRCFNWFLHFRSSSSILGAPADDGSRCVQILFARGKVQVKKAPAEKLNFDSIRLRRWHPQGGAAPTHWRGTIREALHLEGRHRHLLSIFSNITAMPRPRSVTQAVIAIWFTIGLDFLVTNIECFDGTMSSGQFALNLISCLLYGLLTNRISAGNNLARHVYAILIAVEVAALSAFGLDDATGLEAAVSYVSIPLEFWIMLALFRADGNPWFQKGSQAGRK